MGRTLADFAFLLRVCGFLLRAVAGRGSTWAEVDALVVVVVVVVGGLRALLVGLVLVDLHGLVGAVGRAAVGGRGDTTHGRVGSRWQLCLWSERRVREEDGR